MQDTINHSGYISIGRMVDNKETTKVESNTVRYAYEFNCGDLVIHAFERIPEIDGKNAVTACDFDDIEYLFYSKLPFSFPDFSNYPQNNHQKIDFAVKNYKRGSKYKEAVFDFAELQFFCPSGSVVKEDEERNVIFSGKPKNISTFNIEVNSIECEVSFIIGAKGKWGFARSMMEAVTELHISFPETDDFKFINNLYLVVDCVFAFICNRRNSTCLSMKVKGTYPSKFIDNDKFVDCIKHCDSEIYYFDKYREDPENEKIIAKTWTESLFFKHIDALFTMVSDDISGKLEDGGKISIASIHPSIKRRNLIDLQQSIQISSAFEFYVRRYLPNMMEEKSHHVIMKMILKEIEAKSTGKLRELAKSLSKNVVREPALEDKVIKVYKGYDKWPALALCISEDWYKPDEIRALGDEANQWRNELAHAKRSYEPSENTVRAIRLLEHMNYAIVLRKIGFSDEEIKKILENALIRQYY
ncbi:hypothetical protein BXO88_14575 [Oribacterium sp. C9]|uniref:HEPN domain-containing protein n=1 Tax=Oribacterium sp. C9 TaxID=1943579 RepID=UPI00098FFD9E|nr:HEPN domain-containing protein [Oribacterium sp. C9]OON85009.1 hypothetical protein BXO88_14575 [Oribacterium sp. C9]